MKTLIFSILILVLGFGFPTLLGAILADRKAKTKDYLRKIILPLAVTSLIILIIELAWFLKRGAGCLNFEYLLFSTEIFFPLLIVSGSSLILSISYRIRYIQEKNKWAEFGMLIYPSLLAILISSFPIWEWVINL